MSKAVTATLIATAFGVAVSLAGFALNSAVAHEAQLAKVEAVQGSTDRRVDTLCEDVREIKSDIKELLQRLPERRR